jgi:ERCC4-type nuclease
MIRVLVDSNEQSFSRAGELHAAVNKHPDHFTWEGYSEIPVDIRFGDTDNRGYISVELKTPADLVSSILSGHLAQQLLLLHNAPEPGFIVCTGTIKDTFGFVSPVVKGKYRGKDAIVADFARIEEFNAAAFALGYPVFYWDMNWAGQTLKHIRAMFETPSILKFLHKDKKCSTQAAMLCMIPGVGATTAEALLEKCGTIDMICKSNPESLEEIKVNGKRLGKKANIIWRVLNEF